MKKLNKVLLFLIIILGVLSIFLVIEKVDFKRSNKLVVGYNYNNTITPTQLYIPENPQELYTEISLSNPAYFYYRFSTAKQEYHNILEEKAKNLGSCEYMNKRGFNMCWDNAIPYDTDSLLYPVWSSLTTMRLLEYSNTVYYEDNEFLFASNLEKLIVLFWKPDLIKANRYGWIDNDAILVLEKNPTEKSITHRIFDKRLEYFNQFHDIPYACLFFECMEGKFDTYIEL